MELTEFKYFRGPQGDMAGLCLEPTGCIFCGRVGPCFRLGAAICPTLDQAQKENAHGCFSCLKAGRFQCWHDTEIGVLDESGLTHIYNHNKKPPSDFPRTALVELRKTPQIVTWQQELWLIHCNDFMAYVGTWTPEDFYKNAPDGDGRSLFLRMTDRYNHLWDSSLREGEERLASWRATYYAFRCLHCGELRGNWDCD
jgi:uncharacterized protein CbrC (UPF0167 family)